MLYEVITLEHRPGVRNEDVATRGEPGGLEREGRGFLERDEDEPTRKVRQTLLDLLEEGAPARSRQSGIAHNSYNFV